MKSLLLVLGLIVLFVADVSYAATTALPNPSAAVITGGIQCGQPLVTAVVTGFSEDGQYVLGQVSTKFSCSSGGRGSKPHTYNACALIAWTVLSYETYQVTYSPCAVSDPTLVFMFGDNSAWTMDGVGQLRIP